MWACRRITHCAAMAADDRFSALVIIAGVWYWLQRPVATRSAKGREPGIRVVGIIAVALAEAATVMTVIVPHSGATAVWEGRYAQPGAGTGGFDLSAYQHRCERLHAGAGEGARDTSGLLERRRGHRVQPDGMDSQA